MSQHSSFGGGDPVRLAPFTRDPDLTRSAGDGYVVTCSFKPDLARAERAVVEVLHHGVSVDILDVPADEGYETWKHPVLRAETYAEALR